MVSVSSPDSPDIVVGLACIFSASHRISEHPCGWRSATRTACSGKARPGQHAEASGAVGPA